MFAKVSVVQLRLCSRCWLSSGRASIAMQDAGAASAVAPAAHAAAADSPGPADRGGRGRQLDTGSTGWHARIEGSIARSRKVKGGNYVQLATVDEDGDPACRTVVFRGGPRGLGLSRARAVGIVPCCAVSRPLPTWCPAGAVARACEPAKSARGRACV